METTSSGLALETFNVNDPDDDGERSCTLSGDNGDFSVVKDVGNNSCQYSACCVFKIARAFKCFICLFVNPFARRFILYSICMSISQSLKAGSISIRKRF
ncbi:hypothetical protein DPMN_181681 [Dreissena polymorpha]|uniref:Uncharacterized protein n=1 Tax=Dreissena polymorpha TaxID=45954 RepID=A0A9D4DE05_DREPO|nr:hypothetical protein DPMN_181681 [Dreissena polymorpha]